ncbi:MAG: beta-galactosidase [Treponema sp.]|nr:beta-galactosidase [Treponema sp.]
MKDGIISYDKHGFIINGKREFLIGGEFHYFKTPAALWEDRLQKFKATGANLISVYIAWNMHEPEEGKQRWDGDYDLDRFLTLCQKYGLRVLIKPGPYICAELDFGGHPDWLIAKIARGEFRLRMMDQKYLDLCSYWYKSCADQINKHLITNGGCIIAAQLENEYDHLIEYGEETITVDDAIAYFMFLKGTMEKFGIDVPKFANEAEFLRGRGIIDTRTYYPDIPGLWMGEFERFEEKLLSSKKSQSDSPIMILELQAGWFSQIGAPTYEPDLDLVASVSKSVFITGASIVNYYMMAGGTMFPFIGARGDTSLGGYGNITSYDFGGSPIRESGEIHKDKYYWIKGFIRFAREFSKIITESDGKRYVSITGGGEDIAVLGKDSAALDISLNKGFENFTTYEEGCGNGRFFFVRNVEEQPKSLEISVASDVTGSPYKFRTTIAPKETRMVPIAFKAGGLRINYATSELLLTKAYGAETAIVLCGKKGTTGELSLNVEAGTIRIISGNTELYPNGSASTTLRYVHDGIQIVKTGTHTLFLVDTSYCGRIEELKDGLLFHDCYYLQELAEKADCVSLTLQVKEQANNKVRFYSMTGGKGFQTAAWDNEPLPVKTCSCGMRSTGLKTGKFTNRPTVQWTSDWKYKSDSAETDPAYNHSAWRKLEKPISLEEAGFLEHGYYWYRTQFTIDKTPEHIFMSFEHNDVDRYLVYVNGELVFRSRNKSIRQKDITRQLKPGSNSLTVLYANEFHNKSHPHEGAIVKYSGIMKPFIISGKYSDGTAVNISLESFSVRQGLQGMADGFTKLACNDSGWRTAPKAKKLVTDKELGHIVWFRRNFTCSAAAEFSAPLEYIPLGADERLTAYVNGWPLARYDILGPQENFFIPESYTNINGDNVLSVILECPGFYEEIGSGYRRGFMMAPELVHSYIAKRVTLTLK